MKKMFPGFYSPSEEELDKAWKDDKTLFVFDTNTLLNLYGYASQTREDFFTILEVISDRIWIPYHVGLEYQRRRLSVIRDEKAVFKKLEGLLADVDKIFESDFSGLALNRRFPTLFKNTEKLHTDIKKLISGYKKSVSHWDQKQPCVRGHDNIRERINKLFDSKIGEIPENQEFLNEIFKEGDKRYKHNIPPGFKDKKKSERDDSTFFYAGLEYDSQYGDLIIWKQLINQVKEHDISSVVFITDDAKEDWWYIINSRGEKNIGPRAELREEICRDGNISLFSMYNTSSFLESGKKLLEVDVQEASIDDASQTFFDKVKIRHLFEQNAKVLKVIEDSQEAKIFQDLDKLSAARSAYELESTPIFNDTYGKYSIDVINKILDKNSLDEHKLDMLGKHKLKILEKQFNQNNLFSNDNENDEFNE